ncbi:MAG TPA: hypothetical protein VHJ38_15605 [Nitrososphaeraceae archaeon]|jgi:hypothetical protein|nr:hypothetical protein [Nitrososphaeraceae archaeon]
MNTKVVGTIIAFLLINGIMTTSSQSIFAKVSDSSVNNNNIITNEINNIFMSKTTATTGTSNNSNSSEMCKMPDCPLDQTCVQVCPESLPPPV